MSEGMEASMCSCDYESWDWCEVRDIKARKQHKCCECKEPIEPGEVYEKVDAIWEHEFWHYKTCILCARIRKDYCAGHGELRETIWGGLGFDYVTGESAYDDEDDQPQDEGRG